MAETTVNEHGQQVVEMVHSATDSTRTFVISPSGAIVSGDEDASGALLDQVQESANEFADTVDSSWTVAESTLREEGLGVIVVEMENSVTNQTQTFAIDMWVNDDVNGEQVIITMTNVETDNYVSVRMDRSGRIIQGSDEFLEGIRGLLHTSSAFNRQFEEILVDAEYGPISVAFAESESDNEESDNEEGRPLNFGVMFPFD